VGRAAATTRRRRLPPGQQQTLYRILPVCLGCGSPALRVVKTVGDIGFGGRLQYVICCRCNARQKINWELPESFQQPE
jgi:hypothetical protein